jgi:hypothetical protein
MEIKLLSFPAESPPLAVIVAAKLSGFDLPSDTSLPPDSAPTLLFSNGYSSIAFTIIHMNVDSFFFFLIIIIIIFKFISSVTFEVKTKHALLGC